MLKILTAALALVILITGCSRSMTSASSDGAVKTDGGAKVPG
jgi:hypothetical protein